MRVGGRLRRLESPNVEQIHPIVLDSRHPATKLLIRDFDERLLHPGTERVYAELRRQYWILRGRQAVKHHQLNCSSCQRWRAQPKVPQMADLPPERLRLLCPPFYSTGVDCFGPYHVKIGRRVEKRWGVIFKCLTTRAVHIELLNSLDVDAFLLALRRFIARRGRPKEIRSDCGTNFRGADRELREAFAAMESQLKEQLADYQILFKFNPPNAPHFGGVLGARGPLHQSCSTGGSWKSVCLRRCPVYSISRGRGHFEFKTPWICFHRRCGSRPHYTKPSPHGAARCITSAGGVCFRRYGAAPMAPLSKSCGLILDSVYRKILTLTTDTPEVAKAIRHSYSGISGFGN